MKTKSWDLLIMTISFCGVVGVCTLMVFLLATLLSQYMPFRAAVALSSASYLCCIQLYKWWFSWRRRGHWWPPVIYLVTRKRTIGLLSAVRWPGFPRAWELLGFLLGRIIRERIYTPVHQELLEDYMVAKRYRTKWARRWLAFCFTLRTFLLLGECFRAALADKGAQLLLKLIPEPVRHWWATKGP